MVKYFGIKRPARDNIESYIWWIAETESAAWALFFGTNVHRLPTGEAIKAYESIGYRCVELEVTEKQR